MILRDYQQECINSIPEEGSYLIQMATGLGKTVTFANIPRRGRMLILSHREELVNQPKKYFNCSYGIEQSKSTSNGEEVVSASVQSLIRRLDKFNSNDFDIIITDEAHHAAATSYRKIYEHFNPRLHLGFTATPNRGDKVRLDDIYQSIIFQRDLKWGIRNNYLSDIHCLRANIGFNLSQVANRMGDYAIGELDAAMDIESQNQAIAEAYYKYAKGQTLIFATSVNHAQNIAKEIKDAVAVTADTKDRDEIIRRFTRREIPVLVNCMVFTEGTDMPLIETIIIARPTQNDSLYTQMVGRGLRLHSDKEKLILIDCVGITGKASLCTAPSLLGIDVSELPKKVQNEIEGDLFDLPDIVIRKSDIPESWIKNTEIVDLWAKEQKYDTHDINWFKLPTGKMVCSLPDNIKITIEPQDELGNTYYDGTYMPMQDAFDCAYRDLQTYFLGYEYVWNLQKVKYWGKLPASDKQLNVIRKKIKNLDVNSLTKLEASNILNRLFNGGRQYA